MSRIIIITSGITSVVNACLVMADRLRKDGHEVTYGSSARIEETVTDAGIPFVVLPDLQKLAISHNSTTEELQRALDSFLESLAGSKFDMSIIDIEYHEYIVSSKSFANKLVLMSTFLSLWRRPGLPPLHYPTLPEPGQLSKADNYHALWLGHIAKKILRNRIGKIRRLGNDRISRIQKLAKSSGFQWSQKKDETQWLNPVFYRDIPVLNLNDPKLDFPHSPNKDVYYTGSMHNIEHAEKPGVLKAAELERLHRLLDANQSAEGRPLIYCAFGRFKASYDKEFISKVIFSAKDRPAWDVFISLGGHLSDKHFSDLPDNVYLFAWLPQTDILKSASCAVIHSGISSINECIHSRTPMVLYSLGIRDQDGNAARVAFNHLGIRGNRCNDTSEDIAQHIESAMSDNRMADCLARFHHQANDFVISRALENAVDSLMHEHNG